MPAAGKNAQRNPDSADPAAKDGGEQGRNTA
jgi:hypothetical protein